MKYGGQTSGGGLASLRQFVKKSPGPSIERCDLCAAALAEQHQHLIEPRNRRLLCACDACSILFTSGGETNLKRVPRDAWCLDAFVLSDQAWNSLGIPIGLVFIYKSSVSAGILAVYPSPGGPTETGLDADAWDEIVHDNPQFWDLDTDVEALLINRMNGAREYFRAPIDECYKLTGIVRKYWRGFSGGEEGWQQITQFFVELKARSYARSLV